MHPSESLALNEDYQRLPELLRDLLDAELVAGNAVVEIFHSFPAPPTGACFRLAKPLKTRSPNASDGLDYYPRNSSLYSGEITDAKRFYFLIEPPLPPEAEPDVNATRESAVLSFSAKFAHPMESPLVAQFKSSMLMNYEKWHDGIGYEVSLLAHMNDAEKLEIEQLIMNQSSFEWFDVEAIALINTPEARERLIEAARDNNFAVRNAVQRYAPNLVAESTRTASLVMALRESSLYGGLSQALDEAEDFHPPEVIQALLDGAQYRDGETATLMAAMLFYILEKVTNHLI